MTVCLIPLRGRDLCILVLFIISDFIPAARKLNRYLLFVYILGGTHSEQGLFKTMYLKNYKSSVPETILRVKPRIQTLPVTIVCFSLSFLTLMKLLLRFIAQNFHRIL